MKVPTLHLKSAKSYFQGCLNKSPVTLSRPLWYLASGMLQHPLPADLSPPEGCLIADYPKCSWHTEAYIFLQINAAVAPMALRVDENIFLELLQTLFLSARSHKRLPGYTAPSETHSTWTTSLALLDLVSPLHIHPLSLQAY